MRDQAIGRGKVACSACGRIKSGSWSLERTPEPEALDPSAPAPDLARPWYWEGNVQACVVSELRARGYRIESVVDTSTKEPGTDIIARSSEGRTLWVSVKGFPQKSSYTQARHWFAGALLDMVLYRAEDADVDLAIALPEGFATYKALVARTVWLRAAVPFSVYWAAESGKVTLEADRAEVLSRDG
jgi:hypothetical protein